MEKYVVLGAGGHASVVLDTLELNKRKICGLTDYNMLFGELCMGYPILGTDEILAELFATGITCAAMGIGHVGNFAVRNKVYTKAKEIGYVFPEIKHPSAVLSASVRRNEGNQFLANCTVNAGAQIGSLCIVNTGAVVEHETILGDGVHVAPRAVILGRARIGNNTFIGAGSVVLQGVHVGENCIIGAGSVILHDVEDNSVVVGTPGRLLRRRTM